LIHRQSYDEFSPKPKALQLLWWEFPPEQWEELREGCRMNFLTTPPQMIHQSTNMDEEQLKISADFVDDLVSLGVLRLPKDTQDGYKTRPARSMAVHCGYALGRAEPMLWV
jgi:hypothetical protein